MRGQVGLVACTVLVTLGCGEPLRLGQAGAAEVGEANLVLLHTSDLHSRVWPFRERISAFEAALGLGRSGALDEVGGFARLASVLEGERQGSPLPWLDSGDALEGAEVFHRFGGQVELELLGALGLSAMALGNHELSLSAAELAALLDRVPFPVLAANLDVSRGSPLAGRVGSSVLLITQGLELGVVGVANQGSPPNLASPENPWGLSVATDLAAAVQAEIDLLAPRASVIVLLSHLGLDGDRELLRGTSGVDLVLGGHQHIVTATPEWQDDCALSVVRRQRGCSSRPVPIVHSGAYGKLVSRLELSLTRAPDVRDAWEVADLELRQLPLSSSVPQRFDVLERLEQRQPEARPPLGFVPKQLPRRSALGGDSPLGNLTVDALRAASGADVVLINSSGLRGDVEAGLLLESDLDLVLPFAEPWLTAYTSGSRLKQGLLRASRRSADRECEAVLQVSGLKLRIDCAACREQRAACVDVLRPDLLGERPLADDEILRLSLPAYLTRAGADFEGIHAGVGEELAVSARGALVRYIAELSGAAASADSCVESVAGLGSARCQLAFGAVACPVERRRAVSFCRAWPRIVGGRDERIEMLP